MNDRAAFAIMPVDLYRRVKRAGLIYFDQDDWRFVGQAVRVSIGAGVHMSVHDFEGWEAVRTGSPHLDLPVDRYSVTRLAEQGIKHSAHESLGGDVAKSGLAPPPTA